MPNRPATLPETTDGDSIARALRAWRREASADTGTLRLTVEARQAVLHGSLDRDPATGASPSHLFPMIPWRGLAWTVPVLLAAVLVIPIALRPTVDDVVQDPVQLRVAKIDGKVVFRIQNGGTPHKVSKSSDPGRFDPSAVVPVTDGAFEDDAQDGPALVFYRIE